MTVWEAWNVHYLSCQPYISLKVEYRVFGKHVSLDTPTADCCVRYLSLIRPIGLCRLCETLVSRILDVERGALSGILSSKIAVSCIKYVTYLPLETSSVFDRTCVWYCSQTTRNVDIHSVRFMSLGNLIVERRVWFISHCARNGLLILSLLLPYVRSRIVTSDCCQLRCFSWFP
jgi:hypothetical protein